MLQDTTITTHGTRFSQKALVLLLSLFGSASLQAQEQLDSKARVDSWYLQTVVTTEAGAIDERSGVIGRISGGRTGKDVHDIPAFASVNGAPVAVISLRGAEWGDDAGEYLSDYRAPGQSAASWDLVVTSSDPQAEVTLSWDGLYAISGSQSRGFETRLSNNSKTLRSLRLIDLQRGKVVRRGSKKDGSIKSYTFNMGGENERHFRWVQGKPTDDDFLASPVRLDTLSPLPVIDEQSLTVAGEIAPLGKGSRGFSGPPSLGIQPGQGAAVPRPGDDALSPGNPASAQPLFQPVTEDDTLEN